MEATVRVILMATDQAKATSREAAMATSRILAGKETQVAREGHLAAVGSTVVAKVTRMDTATSQDQGKARAAAGTGIRINSPKEGEVTADREVMATQEVEVKGLAKEIPKDKIKINTIIITIKVKEDNDVFLDQCYQFYLNNKI